MIQVPAGFRGTGELSVQAGGTGAVTFFDAAQGSAAGQPTRHLTEANLLTAGGFPVYVGATRPGTVHVQLASSTGATAAVNLECEVIKVQCQVQGSAHTVDVDLSKPLFVLKDSTITLQLMKGTQALISQNATFSQVSTSRTDLKRAALTYTGRAVNVEVVVCTVEMKLEPKDNFHGRSKTEFGVNEPIKLKSKITPGNPTTGVTAAELGGLTWSVVGPVGANAHGQIGSSEGAFATRPTTSGEAFYKAPITTNGTTTVVDPTAKTKAVTLRLTFNGGCHKDKQLSKNITVHAPEAVMTQDTTRGTQHKASVPSAGFYGLIRFWPPDVSFKFLVWQEGAGTAEAHEMNVPGWTRKRVGGYFAYDHGKVHQKTIVTALQVMTVTRDNNRVGCWVDQVDNVYSGWNEHYGLYGRSVYPPATFYGRADVSNLPIFVPSEISWKIEWMYADAATTTNANAAAAEWFTFQRANHSCLMDAAGRVTISKAGAYVTIGLP